MTGPLIDLNGRVRDRTRERRQRRVAVGKRVLLVLAVLAVLGWVATGSPLFSVREVKVTGNALVTADAIVAAAEVPMGVPLAQVDRAAIANRLTVVPAIGRGVVSASLPGTVTIAVTERTVAFVVPADGAYRWIDATGMNFGQSVKAPSGAPKAQADPTDRQLLADVATVLGALPRPLSDSVELISAPTRDSIKVRTKKGLTITWGSADNSPLKGSTASALAAAKPRCEAIDVSSPTQPTTRC